MSRSGSFRTGPLARLTGMLNAVLRLMVGELFPVLRIRFALDVVLEFPELSHDVTISFGCRITFLLQSRCATISTPAAFLDVGIYFGFKNPIPLAGMTVELVGNVRLGVKPPG